MVVEKEALGIHVAVVVGIKVAFNFFKSMVKEFEGEEVFVKVLEDKAVIDAIGVVVNFWKSVQLPQVFEAFLFGWSSLSPSSLDKVGVSVGLAGVVKNVFDADIGHKSIRH